MSEIEYEEIMIRMNQTHSGVRPNIDSLNTHGKDGWIFIQVTQEQASGCDWKTGYALFYRHVESTTTDKE